LIIRKLQIENFRNIRQVASRTAHCLNLLHGDNGAGKTSVLEAWFAVARPLVPYHAGARS
jgi:recombinational DNA repair ATPase RecF